MNSSQQLCVQSMHNMRKSVLFSKFHLKKFNIIPVVYRLRLRTYLRVIWKEVLFNGMFVFSLCSSTSSSWPYRTMSNFQNQLLFKQTTGLKSRVLILKQNELLYSSKGMDVAEFFKPRELKELVTRVSILKNKELSFSPMNMEYAEYFTERQMGRIQDSAYPLTGKKI